MATSEEPALEEKLKIAQEKLGMATLAWGNISTPGDRAQATLDRNEKQQDPTLKLSEEREKELIALVRKTEEDCKPYEEEYNLWKGRVDKLKEKIAEAEAMQ